VVVNGGAASATTTPQITQLHDPNGGTILDTQPATGAVNYLQIRNAIAGDRVRLLALGADPNISLSLRCGGQSTVFFADGNGAIIIQGTAQTGGAVNYVNVNNSLVGADPQIQAAGNDTNINLSLLGKGTGIVKANGIEVKTKNSATISALVTNSTPTQAPLVKLLIPANTLKVGKSYRITTVSTNSTSASITWNLYFGPNGTTADTLLSTTNFTSATANFMTGLMTCYAIGSAGSLVSALSVLLTGNAGTIAPLTPVTVNTTVDNYLTVSAAAASGTLSTTLGHIEEI
jgi:hypothetical protein